MMDITYSTYKKINGSGPDYLCEVREKGKSRLIFNGNDAGEAIDRAREWASKSFDTPERRARMAELAQKRSESRARKGPRDGR